MDVIITLGLPASGKSFFVDKYLPYRLTKVDSDKFTNFDPRLTYSARNLKAIEQAESLVKSKLDHVLMAAGGGSKFEETLKYYKKHEYLITVFYFDTNKIIALDINQRRERKVPAYCFTEIETDLIKNISIAKQYADFFYTITPSFK